MLRGHFVLLVVSVAVVSGKRFSMSCISSSETACRKRCCPVGWTLEGSEGTYTCTDATTTCGLCGQPGIDECDVSKESCGLLIGGPTQVGPDGKPVPVEESTSDAGAGLAGASGGTGALPPTFPSNGVTMTFGTHNGMDGWQDIAPSRFFGFQGYMQGIVATVPTFYTKAGFHVQYSCKAPKAGPTVTACDIFFFIYRCPPCQSETSGIGAQLLSSADATWYVGNCGPSFKLDSVKGATHRFSVYEAEIPVGTSVTVTAAGPLEFIFWAMVAKNVICADHLDEASCNAWSDNCEWLGSGVCRPQVCEKNPPLHQGPPTPMCEVCIYDDELTLLPPLVL